MAVRQTDGLYKSTFTLLYIIGSHRTIAVKNTHMTVTRPDRITLTSVNAQNTTKIKNNEQQLGVVPER